MSNYLLIYLMPYEVAMFVVGRAKQVSLDIRPFRNVHKAQNG
jgi:hypothetical protein